MLRRMKADSWAGKNKYNCYLNEVFMKHLKLLLMLGIVWSFALHAQDKPNILVIWGDDIGWANVSKYNHGIMGYQTPNIDKLGDEGAMFTDWYAQQSCTAGRAAFVTGQHPFRTGLLTIGMPGSPHGISEEMPTIADLLKPHGYMSGQFGKNHLGDRDEHLPTNHGFDEFFGNLYHLNAEEEPETYYYPKDPEFKRNTVPVELFTVLPTARSKIPAR
jgi:arylsulfatase A-like enzyme